MHHRNALLVPALAASLICCAAFGEVRLEIGSGTVAPGQEDGVVPISLAVDPGEDAVIGYQFVIRYDPAALGEVVIEDLRDADNFWFVAPMTFKDPGTVGAAAILDLLDPLSEKFLSASNDGIVARLRFCVLETAAPGTYALEFVPAADRAIGAPTMVTSYTVAGESRAPLASAGSVAVEGAPVAGGGCTADIRNPRFRASYRITDRNALPGGTVDLPFFILGSGGGIVGFSFSIDFDESVLGAIAVEDIFQKPDGSDYEFRRVAFNNKDDTPGNAGVDEGFIAGGIVFSFGLDPVALPANVETEVLRFRMEVKPAAPMGETPIRFLEGGSTGGQPIPNIVTIEGTSVPPTGNIAMILINGKIAIIGDVTSFIRGDSNGDYRVDISDPQFTLAFLFLGGTPPRCSDAADANDDGDVDISDPIFTLDHLFLGGGGIPPPASAPGKDPTPDSLDCESGLRR